MSDFRQLRSITNSASSICQPLTATGVRIILIQVACSLAKVLKSLVGAIVNQRA